MRHADVRENERLDKGLKLLTLFNHRLRFLGLGFGVWGLSGIRENIPEVPGALQAGNDCCENPGTWSQMAFLADIDYIKHAT